MPALTVTSPETIQAMTDRIVERFHPVTVILGRSGPGGNLVGPALRPALREGRLLYERA